MEPASTADDRLDLRRPLVKLVANEAGARGILLLVVTERIMNVQVKDLRVRKTKVLNQCLNRPGFAGGSNSVVKQEAPTNAAPYSALGGAPAHSPAVVGPAGLEPALSCEKQILSLLCLPIPPRARRGRMIAAGSTRA